jgi:protein-disulfide isomerase
MQMRRSIFEGPMRAFLTTSYRRRTVIAAASLLALGSAAVVAAPAKPAWLTTFTMSAMGGHIIGNPAAPTKVVEYASYTCGHCAHFEIDEAPLLKNAFVATGKTSFEIRNLVRDPLDLTAALLARCGGKGRFFGNHKQLMATQGQWADGGKLSKATEAKLAADDLVGFMQGAYTELGLNTIMQVRGVTTAQAKLCLADAKALAQVIAMTDEADAIGVTGTPSFTINGKLVAGHDLAAIKPHLPK